MATKTYNEKGQVVYLDDDGKDVTQETSVKNQKQSDKETKKAQKEAKKTLKEKWQDFVKQGQADENDLNLVMSTGSGASIVTDDTSTGKKELPEGSSSGTDTIPLPKDVQEKIDTSNDATRQEKEQIKEAADEVRDYVNKNDMSEVAKNAMQQYGLNTALIDTNYTKGLPKSILKAWKDGKFGTPSTKDSKSVRNYLMLNELGTMLSNMGAGVKGGESKEALWTSSVRKNMEEADARNNEKFKADMNNQMQQLNIGAEDQIELNKRISELMADNTFALAAKHAGNIEDTIGLWYLKEALGNRWSKMSGDEKVSFLSAVNAMNNGDAPSAQAIMLATFGTDETANIIRQMQINAGKNSNYDTNIKKAQSDTAQANAWLDVTSKGISAVDDFISVIGNGATGGVAGAITK